MAKSAVIEIFQDFLSLIYPNCCLGCDDALVKGEQTICTRCLLEMPRTNYHLEPENRFYQKFRGRIPVHRVMAFFQFIKKSKVQYLLHKLKYDNHPEIGVSIGKIYGGDLLRAGFATEFDLIIPVPLHASKKRKRTYNQSEQFGIGLSEILNVPCSDKILKRLRTTETQTRKTKLGRWENVSDVFVIQTPEDVQGKRVLLVDDVMTTGATLEACSSAIIAAGSSALSIACIAAAQ